MPYKKISDKWDIEEYNDRNKGFIDPSIKLEGTITVGRGIVIENDVELGAGCFIGHHATIRPFTKMGERSELRAYGWLANNVTIGKYTVVYQYANICMGAILGDYIYFGCKSILTNAHDVVLYRNREFQPDPPFIEDGARILTSCTFLPGITVGKNALVGAGSLVTKDIPENQVWFGRPARYVRNVSKHDVPEVWENK